jgi:FemAB-related protein (PEP-CTERM system-associated)
MDRQTGNESAEPRVSELEEGTRARWDEFVELTGGTFFHLSGWQKIIGNALGHRTYYRYCERGGKVVGVLPMARVRSALFGDALISTPFLVYGGILAEDADIEALLVKDATKLANKLGVDYLELRNRVASGRPWVNRDHYATFSRHIDPDPEVNLRAIPRKQRAMIRKGIKAGLRAEVDDNVDRLYEALLACKRNLGTPFFDARYLRAVKDEFGEKAEILTVLHDNEIVASVMSFRYRNEILPYYGGGGLLARDLKGNDFMYWSVMEKACQEGVEVFDFGRSMVGTGAYRFKKHWGFEPQPLSYEYLPVRKQALPSLNPSNPKYQRLIRMWQKLPLPIAARLGPPLARRLG